MKQLRRNTDRYKRLGKNRKKLQKWRRPRGRHSKIRERKRGYTSMVEVGSRKPRKERGRIDGMDIARVENIKDLESIKDKKIIVIAKMGKRKRQEIEKKAKELNLRMLR